MLDNKEALIKSTSTKLRVVNIYIILVARSELDYIINSNTDTILLAMLSDPSLGVVTYNANRNTY